MADKPEKKPEAAPAADKKDAPKAAHGGGGGKGGLLSKTPVLMGIAMVLEAVVLFAGFKFLGGGPKPAAGAETAEHDGGEHGDGHGGGADGKEKPKEQKKKSAEVPVVELRAPNKVSGRTLLFDVKIVVRAKGEHEEAVKQKIADNQALITDRVRTIMAQSDPEKLGGGSEPGLETLRRQVKYQLDEVFGEGMVEEVLVPRCIPFRADF
jgi:flagellar basal body-associated protein FliL